MNPCRSDPCHSLQPGPLGDMLITVDDGALTGLYFVGQKDEPKVRTGWRRDDRDPVVLRVVGQLARYFDGEAAAFDVPIRLSGTAFQRRVWDALLGIPAGRTASYRDIARRVDAPGACRAVGAAIGRNPVSIIVPCHRVVGSDGSLTGYAGGIDRKRHLLRLEGVL